MPPHIEHEGLAFGAIVCGAEEMRAQVRKFIKYGVDLIKLNMSGEEIAGVPATHTPITDEEVAAATDEARRRGIRACGHARSAESVKMCVRHGIPIVYHASYADEEGLDMLEANSDKHFVAPGLAWLIKTSQTPATGASSRAASWRRRTSTNSTWRWRRCRKCASVV